MPHRVWEEGGAVHLVIPEDPKLANILAEGVAALRSGALTAPERDESTSEAAVALLLRGAQRTPATTLCVLLALLFFPFTALESQSLGDFTPVGWAIVPIERLEAFISFPSLETTLKAGEIWALDSGLPSLRRSSPALQSAVALGFWPSCGIGRWRGSLARGDDFHRADRERGAVRGRRWPQVRRIVGLRVRPARISCRRASLDRAVRVFALPVGVVLFLILVAFSTGAASAFGPMWRMALTGADFWRGWCSQRYASDPLGAASHRSRAELHEAIGYQRNR